MANPVPVRAHSYVLIKSESTLMQWSCHLCYLGELWAVYECEYCKRKVCSPSCMAKDISPCCSG
jgi:hypothetical protein